MILGPCVIRSTSTARTCTGVPRSKETAPPLDPTEGTCLGFYGGPRGVCGARREQVNGPHLYYRFRNCWPHMYAIMKKSSNTGHFWRFPLIPTTFGTRPLPTHIPGCQLEMRRKLGAQIEDVA
jgi:hypothetical protein